MIHITETSDAVTLHCDTWEDFERAANKPKLNGGASDRTSSQLHDFFYFDTWEEAMDAFKVKGWPEGWDKIKESSNQIKDVGSMSLRFEPQFSDSGDEFDIGRFLEGENEHMITYRMEECGSPGQIYSIEYNPVASASFTPHELLMRGLVVLGLYDKIVRAGGSCEISLNFSVETDLRNGGKRMAIHITTPICSPDKPMSGERIAFALCNPDFFRRCILRVMEAHFSEDIRKAFRVGAYEVNGAGYGIPSGHKGISCEGGTFKVGAMVCYGKREDKWPQTPEEAAQEIDKLLSDGLQHSTNKAS